MADNGESDWLLLAASLPGRDAGTARVRLWRTLKDVGAATLRDGVTLIPASAPARDRISELVRGIEKEGGAAWVFTIPPQAPALEKKLKALFDRHQAYGPVTTAVGALRKELVTLDEATARRRLRELEAEFLAVARARLFSGCSAGTDERGARPIAFGARAPVLARGAVDVEGFRQAARPSQVSTRHVGHAQASLGGSSSERLVDPAIHRSRRSVSMARQTRRLPSRRARIRFRRRYVHARWQSRHVRGAACSVPPRGRSGAQWARPPRALSRRRRGSRTRGGWVRGYLGGAARELRR